MLRGVGEIWVRMENQGTACGGMEAGMSIAYDNVRFSVGVVVLC